MKDAGAMARHAPVIMETLLFGPFRLDPAAYSLTRCDADGTHSRIALRSKPFDVLRYLVEHAGRIISQDEFLSALWPQTHVQPEVLKAHILAVRTALDDRAPLVRYVETVRGRGYRFVAQVQTASVTARRDRFADAFLVGRTTARRELDLALARCRSGDMQIVFIAGEAGTGKTALGETFTTHAAATQDVTVAMGHCRPGHGETDAYYPLLEVLTEISRGPLRNDLATALAEWAPTWLAQFPALSSSKPSDVRSGFIGATPHRLTRELCDALDALTRNQFLLLLLDDVQWADRATLDLMGALAVRKLRAKLMIVATLRTPASTEANYTAATLVQKLSLYRLAREIRLQPLEFADVETFLSRFAHAVPPPMLTTHLQARSEGNPLFMRAMLDFLVERQLVSWGENGWLLDPEFEVKSLHTPPNLVQIVEAEIRALPLQEQSVLEAASISDGPFSPLVHHAASALHERAFESICEGMSRRGQLIRRGDVIETPDGQSIQTYTFRHTLFREVAYGRQSITRREARHAAVQERLATVFPADASHRSGPLTPLPSRPTPATGHPFPARGGRDSRAPLRAARSGSASGTGSRPDRQAACERARGSETPGHRGIGKGMFERVRHADRCNLRSLIQARPRS